MIAFQGRGSAHDVTTICKNIDDVLGYNAKLELKARSRSSADGFGATLSQDGRTQGGFTTTSRKASRVSRSPLP